MFDAIRESVSDATWRALRTAWQTFLGVALLAFVNVAQAYASGGIFDWNALWRQGIVLGGAAVAAWYMNRDKTVVEDDVVDEDIPETEDVDATEEGVIAEDDLG